MPLVVTAPERVVPPPAPVARFRMPVKPAPVITVVPLKSRSRSYPAPATPPVNVGVVPARVAFAASVTRPV